MPVHDETAELPTPVGSITRTPPAWAGAGAGAGPGPGRYLSNNDNEVKSRARTPTEMSRITTMRRATLSKVVAETTCWERRYTHHQSVQQPPQKQQQQQQQQQPQQQRLPLQPQPELGQRQRQC